MLEFLKCLIIMLLYLLDYISIIANKKQKVNTFFEKSLKKVILQMKNNRKKVKKSKIKVLF